MRLPRLAALALAVVPAFGTAALAADFDTGPLRGTYYENPGLTPIHGWQGGYFAAFAGMSRGNFDFKGTTQDLIAHLQRFEAVEAEHGISRWLQMRDDDADGRSFGAIAGYNMQFDEVVLGIEADYSRIRLAGASTDSIARTGVMTTNGYNNTVDLFGTSSADLRDYATLRARAGYTMGSFMPFVTAGLAVGRATTRTTVAVALSGVDGDTADSIVLGPYASGVQTASINKESYSIGLAAGLGVDMAVSQNLFLRGEWQYVHFGDFNGVTASVNTVRGAAGVKF